jgi:surface polysaccharide O-acyltransferase-like enzyme
MKAVQFKDNEKLLLIIHRHWFVIARELAAVFFMLLVGTVVFFLRNMLYTLNNTQFVDALAYFLYTVFLLILIALAFALWITYRLDVWIITTRRIIDIEQRSLFNREISEFLIGRVQDVTSEIPNMISTLLDFGTLTIQTAGEKNFYVRDVPKLEEAKKLILEWSEKARRNEYHT